jgi:hypothetical protein
VANRIIGEDLDDVDDDDDDCMCEWDDECSGTGNQQCRGCGGDQCVCKCGGERECPGCDFCDTDELELDDGRGYSDPEEEA